MRWKKIDKTGTVQPTTGKYVDWKQIIADEGQHQCVYCAIHDATFGGVRNFHVEHYRPKSNPQFAALINDIANLFYACPICNTFKSNDWPSEPLDDHSTDAYPNPATVDYCDLFDVDDAGGIIQGKYRAARYLVERLYLNRPQLIMERRLNAVLEHEHIMFHELLAQIEQLALPPDEQNELQMRLLRVIKRSKDLNHRLRTLSPYRVEEVERP